MSQALSNYGVELVNPSGQVVADLIGRANDRSLKETRNDAEDIEWHLDLDELESYAHKLNVDPQTLIIPYQTEVRIKRGTTYLAGGQINYVDYKLDDKGGDVDIRASGFLNLFKDRFTGANPDRVFTATQATTVAQTLINETQAVSSFGITIGGQQATVGAEDITFSRKSIKDALVELSQTDPTFDFEFTYDKQFNTYARLGSTRTNMVFEYPGNIRDLELTVDATQLANEAIMLGSGFGAAVTIVTVDDADSQADYGLRQTVDTSHNDAQTSVLTLKGNALLSAISRPLTVVLATVDNTKFPIFGVDYFLGDYVPLQVTGHPMLVQLNGMYRIEHLELTVDANDDEKLILTMVR